jgi:pimeloyl-ACP methyl ester carboxylesterase
MITANGDLLEPGWRSGARRANGVLLHVVEAGPDDGPLLILLHGFPEFWWAWRRQIGPLAARGFHVVAPDMRGYGLSEAPERVGAYHIDSLVQDVTSLAKSYGAERFQLVGHDWGGVIAWRIATMHPELLLGVVILNAPHPGTLMTQVLAHPTQALRSSYVAFFQLPWLPEVTLRAFGYAAIRRTMTGSARPDTFKPIELGRYVGEWSRPGRLTSMLNYYRALRHRRAALPSHISAPVLLLWGDRDRFLGAHLAHAALAQCANGHLSIIEGATHWLHLEEPDRVNAEILAFLEPKAGGRATARPNTETFRRVLAERFAAAERARRSEIEVTSGDLHREVGGYPGTNHTMPTCCNVMRAAMQAGDAEVAAPPKGKGAILRIRYRLPRDR